MSRRSADSRPPRTAARQDDGAAGAPGRARAGTAGRSGAPGLRIADISLAVSSIDPGMHIQFDAEASRFSATVATPDVRIEAAWGVLSPRCDAVPLFDSGAAWTLYAHREGYLFRCFARSLGAAPYQEATFSRSFRTGRVRLHRPYFDARRAVNPLQYPLDELLILHVLSRGRGAQVHACGVAAASGAGYLFVGQSGAGKSTMARLWEPDPGVTVLSDDRIVLRKINGRFWMYGTPWHGEAGLAQPARAPLTHVFFVRHAQENVLVPVRGAEAAARLFACAFPVFHDRGGLEFTLGFFEDLVGTVPCADLGVVPDDRILGVVRRHASDASANSLPAAP